MNYYDEMIKTQAAEIVFFKQQVKRLQRELKVNQDQDEYKNIEKEFQKTLGFA